ncbi:hypothetical protein [Amycolatopsis sp. lyj-23]|uniref:hypothetical protein n=1 Tax=Amycolatopsis sp. lyj-23 TaxID=2789283 RepID=UPI00397ADD43
MSDQNSPVVSLWLEWLLETPRFTCANDFFLLLPPGQAFVTGGAIRDFVLGRPSAEVRDLDIIYTGDLNDLVRHLGTRYKMTPTLFGNPSVVLSAEVRADIFPPASPRGVRLPLAEALEHADMSGNALAMPLDGGHLLDPTGGRADLLDERTRLLEPGWDAPPEIIAHLLPRVVEQSSRLGLCVDELHVADTACTILADRAERNGDLHLAAVAETYSAWRAQV